MYITATIPYIRDIINSGHNVRVKKCITSFTVTKRLRRDSKYTFLATALIILLIWAYHLSWSSRKTPWWRCSETCSVTCEFDLRQRGGLPHWCFWRVTISFLRVEQHCIRRTPFTYFLDAWLQLSIYSTYISSRSRKRRIFSEHVTINFSRWNTQREIIYGNTEEKRSKNRPLWNSNFDRALRWILSSNK